MLQYPAAFDLNKTNDHGVTNCQFLTTQGLFTHMVQFYSQYA